MTHESSSRLAIIFPWVCLLAFIFSSGCKPLLGPAEDEQIANHAALIAKCEIEARMGVPGMHPVDVFDACMYRGLARGFSDAGAE